MFLANLLIALRDGLEASLVVSVLVAYLVKTGRRDVLPELWIGVALAVLIPLGVGAALTWGPTTLTLQAQEILGGTLSLIAAAMVTWMISWVGRKAREMRQGVESSLSTSLVKRSSGWAVAWISIITVGREGVATALFVWATVRSGIESSTIQTTLGVVTGLALGIVLGYLIYLGAVRIDFHLFLVVTGYFLAVVAAGIAAHGVGGLQEAGVLPGIMSHAWNLSAHLPVLSSPLYWLYAVLNAMFQVNLQPTVLQVVAWVLSIVPVLVLLTWEIRGALPRRAGAASPDDDRSRGRRRTQGPTRMRVLPPASTRLARRP